MAGVAHDGEGALDLRHRVVLWALAMSRPRAATLDRIADALWPGTPPATSAKVIQGSISRLRKAYGSDAIHTVDGGYRLSSSVVTSWDHFERQVARGRHLLAAGQADRAAFVLQDSLESWSGPPFQGLGHWPPAVAEQGRLAELTKQAEELHVEALLAAGRAADALPLARLLATADPLRESRWLTWATAAYHTGNQADALRVLGDCRTTLRDELGIDPGDELGNLEVAILRHDPILVQQPADAASQTCPWRGLNAYEEADADEFYGRDADVAHGLRVFEQAGVLAVAGPSGIGKSSFVRAGLVPALVRSGLAVHVTTPRLGVRGDGVDVLIVDQAEELFALDADQATEALGRMEAVPLVLAIRTDRLSEASRLPTLARLLERGLFLLGGLAEEGLREAIERPALQGGLVLEPRLVDVVLGDVEGEPAALPMLSHALVETWHRREGRTLTIDGYISAGGLRGAITQTAESLYTALDEPHQRELRSLMLRLVSTDDVGETSRVHVLRHRIAVDDDLVDQLVAARLVTSDNDTLALTHEALISAWPRFGEWLADDVEGRRQLQQLSQAAAAWDDTGRPASDLYRGARLDRAAAWAATTAMELSRPEQDFLAAGLDAARDEKDRERRDLEQQRRSNRRLRALASGLAVVTALAVIAGALAVGQQRRAAIETRASAAARLQADANRVAALALNTTDAQLSLLLAVAAERLAPGVVTGRSLSAALAARPELIATATATTVTDPMAPVSGLSDLASSGARLYGLDYRHVLHVFTSSLHPLRTVDLGNGRIDRGPARLTAAADVVAAAAAPGRSPTIELLDAVTLEPAQISLERLPGPGARVDSLDLSPDARTLAAAVASTDGSVVMTWRLPSGDLVGDPIPALKGTVVRISDDGHTVYTSNPVSAYDVRSGRRVWGAPRAAGLDLHEEMAAVSTVGGSRVHLLDAITGERLRTLVGSQGAATDLTFSPAGTLIAANVGDGGVTVWDVVSGRIVHSLQTGTRHGLAYSAFSDTLYTAGGELGSILAWDLLGRRSFLTRIPYDGFRTLSEGVARVSPSGSWASLSSTAPGRPELRLGQLRKDGAVRVVTPGSHWRGVGTWSPDASRYAYADGKGRLHVVDPADGSGLHQRVAARPIVDVAFAGPDRLLSLTEDQELVVADAQTLDVTARLDVPAVATGVTATNRVAVVTSAASKGGATWRVPVTRWHLVDIERGRITANGMVGVTSASVASLSPDGSRVSFGGEEEDLAVLSVPEGTVVGNSQAGAGDRVTSIAWSPDASRLVASVGATLRLWDASRGLEIAQVRLPAGESSSSAGFASDGSISVATRSGSVYRWDPSAAAAAGFACRVAGRELTLTEWSGAFGDRPYRRVCS